MSLIFSKILTEQEVAEIILKKKPSGGMSFLSCVRWEGASEGSNITKGKISWERAQDASKGKFLKASKQVNNEH